MLKQKQFRFFQYGKIPFFKLRKDEVFVLLSSLVEKLSLEYWLCKCAWNYYSDSCHFLFFRPHVSGENLICNTNFCQYPHLLDSFKLVNIINQRHSCASEANISLKTKKGPWECILNIKQRSFLLNYVAALRTFILNLTCFPREANFANAQVKIEEGAFFKG